MSKLTLSSTIKDMQKKDYVRAMKETKCGWNASSSREFNHVGCPNDLHYVRDEDMPHPKHCIMSCEDCWEYVLNNKKDWK